MRRHTFKVFDQHHRVVLTSERFAVDVHDAMVYARFLVEIARRGTQWGGRAPCELSIEVGCPDGEALRIPTPLIEGVSFPVHERMKRVA